MNYFNVDNLKRTFFDYFVNVCGHTQISGASLVPTVDDSVLFTPAGMYPLMPVIAGNKKHPDGNKLVNVQNVVRTGAINRVGEDSFLTFFELFGSWIIGNYDKYDILTKVWKFLISNETLGISPDRIYMTYFDGNEIHGRDNDTFSTWKEIGVAEDHLCPTVKNWKGPYSHDKICGPNTRIFYDTNKEKCCPECSPLCSCGKYVELWDVVFFDYKMKDGNLEKSSNPSVDMGAGVERLASLIQNVETIYETDKLNSIVNAVKSQIEDKNDVDDLNITKKCRIIADHLRCSCMIIGDEVSTEPASKGRGYVLRKILRRTINLTEELGIGFESYELIINKIIDMYKDCNPSLESKRDYIIDEVRNEYILYKTTLRKNLLKIEGAIKGKNNISNSEIKSLFDRYGVPIDMIKNIICEYKILIKE